MLMEPLSILWVALAWTFMGFIGGCAFAMMFAYATLPIARRIIRIHVVLLAYSYTVFISCPGLHALGLWPHDHTTPSLYGVFGDFGFSILGSAAVTGTLGVLLALRFVVQRIRDETQQIAAA